MARTPLASFLRRLHREHRAAEEAGLPVRAWRDEQRERRERSTSSRRDFLKGAGAALGAALLTPALGRAGKPGGGGVAPRIAIVGGGIAGLAAGLTLKDAGYAFTIYEASTQRAGGRMMSSYGTWASTCGECHAPRGQSAQAAFTDGQSVDVFGELIDTGHTTMRSLAQRFGLPLTDLIAAQPAGSTDTYHFLGSYYSDARCLADYKAVYSALQADLKAAGYPTLYNSSTPAGRQLDAMSVYDYIETRIPGGHSSPFGRLIDAAYNIEYGAETTDQSALNLLYLLGYGPRNAFSVFGESDERFHIKGGCQQLTDGIANNLGIGTRIQLGKRLNAISLNADGSVSLSFENTSTPVTADLVILALPFSILRTIDYSRAGFDALKTEAIQQQGQGRNGKLQLQFNRRLWNEVGPWGKGNGNVYTDLGFQIMWDTTRGEAGQSGILANYTGGNVTLGLAQSHPVALSGTWNVDTDARWLLGGIEKVFPGLGATWNGRVIGAIPHKSELFRTSYSYYRVGQAQKYCGYERLPQGNIYFAGEHTSVDFLGFMEGAASEGVATANSIIARIRGR